MSIHAIESNFRRWYWLFVPLLAVAAYLTVLRIGFLGDDFVLVAQGGGRRPAFSYLLPVPGNFLYRPLGSFFIWDLGVRLWGYNPLPMHAQGLLFHAITSLALGLWAAEVTSRRVLGLLAGALFAVFPLHLEAVGWLAAQWDVLATMFGILGLWVFTVWWRKGGRLLYSLSLLLYVLALFTKDSLVTFLPLFALSAWLVTPHPVRKDLLRGAYSLIPFFGVFALNIGLRLAVWGNLGGYPGIRTDYANFFWDSLISEAHVLLSPISTLDLGNVIAQLVGALSTVAIMCGLVLYGRNWLRLFLVAAAWILLALVPVLNLPIKLDDLQQNRLLYLASAGYCVIIAALLYSAIVSARRLRLLTLSGVGAVLLLGIIVCWVQLRPWHTATVLANDLNQELARLIPAPPTPRQGVMTWYVEDPPHDYKGAYTLDLAIGPARRSIGLNDVPAIKRAAPATEAPITSESYDVFALRFTYDENETRSHVAYGVGITSSGPPPSSQEASLGLQVWNFTDCQENVISGWQAEGAEETCEPGAEKGLILRSTGNDSQLYSPPLRIEPAESSARFIRLRVSVRYPSNPNSTVLHNRWFWKGDGADWDEAPSDGMDIRQIGISHIYWVFIPVSDAESSITSLRFDPVDKQINAAIQWIAVDLVK